ncbi:MAG: helix-turn-helix transcriptional regulator [Halanaerobiales bacterium]|nr:helix-turn-helix transcriptional regulator [Halanaerobiales bacterium]
MVDNYFYFKVAVKKIAKFKEDNNLSLGDFNKATGVDRSHLHKILKREVFPSIKTLIRLSNYMDVALYALFFPTQEMLQEELSEKISIRLKELDWDYEKLSTKTEIPLSRIEEIVQENTSISNEEWDNISNILELDISNYRNIKINLMNLIVDI